MSFLKQNSLIPNSYSKALNFIKERILVRNINSNYRVDFRTIIDLERYNNFVRSFIKSFSEGIVDYILKQLKQPTCRVKRFVCESIYRSVISNLREVKFSTVSKADGVKTIQCYAYEHFLMTDIIDEEYGELYSEIFVVEAGEDFYSKAEKFLLSNKIESISLENLCDFAGKYKKDLAKIVHSDITNGTELRKFSVRIERHKDDYAIIGLVYNLGINRDEFFDLSGLEAVAIVYLY